VIQDLEPKQIRFKGFHVVDQVVDCTVDIHAGGTGASGWKKLISGETIASLYESNPYLVNYA
jgi:hypothetical protein